MTVTTACSTYTRESAQVVTDLQTSCNKVVGYRVGRYFDILIYRDIFNRDYRIEGRNLSNDISKLSLCSLTIVILLRMCNSFYKILKIPSISRKYIVFKGIKTIS